jgi:hypothetical protein
MNASHINSKQEDSIIPKTTFDVKVLVAMEVHF